jgi:type I restriction enzyme, S subunit
MSEPPGWRRTTVGDVTARHFSGPSPTCDERNIQSPDEWGLLKTTAITWAGWDEAAHKVPPRPFWGNTNIEVHSGDVLVTKAGPRHRVGVVVHVPSTQPRLMVSGKMIGLTPKADAVLPRLLAGVLATEAPQKYLDHRTTGMAESQVNFSNESLLSTPIVLPPASEQHRIADILDAVDSAIRSTDRLIAKLLLLKRGLIHDLLTRGINERGELRDAAADPGQLATEKNGLLPLGWTVCGLKALVTNHDGMRVPLKQEDRDKRHGDYPYYGASGVIDYVDDFLFDGDFILLGEDGENVVSRQLPLAFRVRGKFWVNNHAHVFSPLPGNDISFLTYLLEFTDYSRSVLGSAQPKLTQAGLSRLLFRVPPLAEQIRIATALDAAVSQIVAERERQTKLRQLKHGLSNDLLTARVRVSVPEDAP